MKTFSILRFLSFVHDSTTMNPNVILNTNMGEIEFELYPEYAPLTWYVYVSHVPFQAISHYRLSALVRFTDLQRKFYTTGIKWIL